MLTCNNDCQLTVQDFFAWMGKIFRLDAEEQVNYLNLILLEFYSDYYNFNSNLEVTPFVVGANPQTISTTHRIRGIEWFYMTCGKSNCVEREKSPCPIEDCCDDCNGCGTPTTMAKINMTYAAKTTTLYTGQYDFCKDWNSVEAKFPCNIENGFVRYFKWFDPIIKPNDCDLSQVCLGIPRYMVPALRMLMYVYYLPESGSSYQGDNVNYYARYQQFMEKMRLADARTVKYLDHELFI